eukprot:11300294-Ditylum_brightwellii.AAC.1
MTGRIIKADTDTSGLGRWSYIKIARKDKKKVTIVTAYRPCEQNKPGEATVNAQQHKVLRSQGIAKPKPCTLWIKDITPKLKTWMKEGEVMLLADANSGLGDKDFAPFIAEIGLCDVIGGKHGIDSPNSHAEGTKAIDFIFCSPDMLAT